AQSGLERKALDSCGISWTDETPQERSDEEAQRQPRGKQVPGAERNGSIVYSHKIYESIKKDESFLSNTRMQKVVIINWRFRLCFG
ncbi:hypothetical protein, partial [Heyndrickxia sporothermodurans]